MELTPEQQIAEIKDEFRDEAAIYKQTRSQVVLNHINALLDCYLELTPIVELGVE